MSHTPEHLLPSSCFVCGDTRRHPSSTAKGGHTFVSNADALADAIARDVSTTVVFPSGATDPAAAYVAEHRPY